MLIQYEKITTTVSLRCTLQDRRTFYLDDGHLNGQTDGRMATTPAHALGYIMLFIGYFTCLKGSLSHLLP